MPNGLLTAQVDVAAANAQIQNHGKIVADGGNVSLQAGRSDTVLNSLINTDGVIQAHSIRMRTAPSIRRRRRRHGHRRVARWMPAR